MGCGVWGVGCGVWGVGCGVWGVGCGVWGLGFGVWGLGLKVEGSTWWHPSSHTHESGKGAVAAGEEAEKSSRST